MDIKEYIESGILEAYVFGSATQAEADQLLKLKVQYPQVKDALEELEENLERIAQEMSIAPPIDSWRKIETELHEIVIRDQQDRLKKPEQVHLISQTNYIRVHKLWRVLAIGLILLGLLFLGLAIFMKSQNQENNQQIDQLKQEINRY